MWGSICVVSGLKCLLHLACIRCMGAWPTGNSQIRQARPSLPQLLLLLLNDLLAIIAESMLMPSVCDLLFTFNLVRDDLQRF